MELSNNITYQEILLYELKKKEKENVSRIIRFWKYIDKHT